LTDILCISATIVKITIGIYGEAICKQPLLRLLLVAGGLPISHDKLLNRVIENKVTRRSLLKFGVAAGIGLAGISVAGCAAPATPTTTPSGNSSASPVPGAELTEYGGQKLDSIGSFRENSIHGTQHINADSYSVTIDGLVDQAKTYAYQDLTALASYQKVVTLHCVEGWDATALWEGVSVKDLLGQAGIKPGTKTVIFYAQDGDTTSFGIDDIKGQDFMLAYKVNNILLTEQHGYPSRLVAAEKWGYKWIKWVTKIELSDQDYKGYWERNGYSNNGDLSQSFFS
jgi:DMSO/TMAO reductase YedYZ molybdopterin-dependent catalytic subunit